MHLVMDEEVKSLAGARHRQHEGRRAHRWGKEHGYCVVDGQKVPIRRKRLRRRGTNSAGGAYCGFAPAGLGDPCGTTRKVAAQDRRTTQKPLAMPTKNTIHWSYKWTANCTGTFRWTRSVKAAVHQMRKGATLWIHS